MISGRPADAADMVKENAVRGIIAEMEQQGTPGIHRR